jgi:hypothetical protein
VRDSIYPERSTLMFDRLDVAQHMSLCRHYVRELRRSVMIGTPEGDKSTSKRSSALLEGLGNLDHGAGGPSMTKTEKEQISATLPTAALDPAMCASPRPKRDPLDPAS